ncbi:DUF3188 domain-containing protein [Arthrobacter sp.]|uniref:DUF3188 domain-containing protein n=1 Tax=Arthrobacter sp. TaxID=1667 RepID=UPI002585D106|nr:DUF3188 domain-containing protein [Arthrobacter sp.]
MLNDFWETAPPAYKYAVFGGMGLTALGIIIIIIGAVTSTPHLTFVGLPFIGVGLIAHMVSLGVRSRAVRKALKEADKRNGGR